MKILKKLSTAIVALSVGGLAFVSPVPVQAGPTGSIKGTVKAKGVRSPENVLIYIENAPGEFKPPAEPVTMDQVNLVFIPYLLPIVKGTTVRFLNSDPVLHNVMWPASKNGAYPAFNLGTWGKGISKDYKYDKLGELVILCNVHPEMVAYVVVLQNPYFAVVDKKGAYEIKDVPPGKYTVKTWYSSPRRLRSQTAEVTVEAGKATQLDFSLSRKKKK